MLIRKHFKPVLKNVILPNPHGVLSSEVSPGAIEAADYRISKTIYLDPVEAQAVQQNCILNTSSKAYD